MRAPTPQRAIGGTIRSVAMSKPGSVPRREDVRQERGFRLIGEVDGQALDFVLKPGDNTVGALPDNDFTIGTRGVSRRHAVVNWSDGGGVYHRPLQQERHPD